MVMIPWMILILILILILIMTRRRINIQFCPSRLWPHHGDCQINWQDTFDILFEDFTMWRRIWRTHPGASNAKADGSDKSVSSRSRVCNCERSPTVTLKKIIIIVIIITQRCFSRRLAKSTKFSRNRIFELRKKLPLILQFYDIFAPIILEALAEHR